MLLQTWPPTRQRPQLRPKTTQHRTRQTGEAVYNEQHQRSYKRSQCTLALCPPLCHATSPCAGIEAQRRRRRRPEVAILWSLFSIQMRRYYQNKVRISVISSKHGAWLDLHGSHQTHSGPASSCSRRKKRDHQQLRRPRPRETAPDPSRAATAAADAVVALSHPLVYPSSRPVRRCFSHLCSP